MKCFRYCSVVLLCCALFLGVFSVGVSAANVELRSYHIYTTFTLLEQNYTVINSYSYNVSPNDGTEQKYNCKHGFDLPYIAPGIRTRQSYKIGHNDNTPLIKAGNQVSVSLNSFYYSVLLSDINYKESKYFNIPSSSYYEITYVDGTTEVLRNSSVNHIGSNRYVDISLSFVPKKDVKFIEVWLEKELRVSDLSINYEWYYIESNIGEFLGDNQNHIVIVQQSEEAGLLQNVIEWLRGIKDGITNLFDSIAELPAKIWQFISDGLKSLFVPDEEFMIEYRDKMDTMLSTKLGSVYQCSNVMFESWDRITASDETNVIDFPSVTINLGDTNFTFGGYEVQIVPNGFDFLVTILKTIIGITATIAFINGMRKRYEEVVG